MLPSVERKMHESAGEVPAFLQEEMYTGKKNQIFYWQCCLHKAQDRL